MAVVIAFSAGFLVGVTLSEWQFAVNVRRACAAVEAAGEE